jgi:hypothetical protein
LGEKTVSLSLAEKGRSCVWELREEKKIAGGGGDCKPKKQQGRGGDGLVSARRKKLGLGFFMVALNFSL